MEKLLKIKVLLALFMLSNTWLISQYSVGGGLSTTSSVGISGTRWGGNIFFEKPRDEVNTLFIRGTLTIPKLDFSNTRFVNQIEFNPDYDQTIQVDIFERTSFMSIDGSNRRYFYNTYEAGFGVYGGFNLRGIVSAKSKRPEDYDTDIYEEVDLDSKSYSFLYGAGVNGGVKFQLPYRGAVNLDFTLELIRPLFDQQNIFGQHISPLIFGMNLSYRFDWY